MTELKLRGGVADNREQRRTYDSGRALEGPCVEVNIV